MKYVGLALLAVAAVIVIVLLLRRSGSKSDPTSGRIPFRMSIDDVFSLKQPGSAVVVGVVAEGEARPNDILFVQTKSGPVRVQVQAMETYLAGSDRSIRVERASKGDRVGIMLAGIEKKQIGPHDLLLSAPPDNASPSGPATGSSSAPLGATTGDRHE